MWRSFFLAMGVFSLLLGAECLAIEQATIKPRIQGGQVIRPEKTVQPPDWAPWSLMAGGAVIVLYTFTLPRRVKD